MPKVIVVSSEKIRRVLISLADGITKAFSFGNLNHFLALPHTFNLELHETSIYKALLESQRK